MFENERASFGRCGRVPAVHVRALALQSFRREKWSIEREKAVVVNDGIDCEQLTASVHWERIDKMAEIAWDIDYCPGPGAEQILDRGQAGGIMCSGDESGANIVEDFFWIAGGEQWDHGVASPRNKLVRDENSCMASSKAARTLGIRARSPPTFTRFHRSQAAGRIPSLR